MTAAAEAVMHDLCEIGAMTRTADAHGQLIPSYSYGASIVCGFDPTGGRGAREAVTMSSGVTLSEQTPTVRLPLGTVVLQGDRVKITTRAGVALTSALVYDVVGAVRQGLTSVLVSLGSTAP